MATKGPMEVLAERNAVTGESGTNPRKQLYWEDVEVGQDIPGYSLEVNWTQIVRQVSGGQDFFPVHYDPDFAAERGDPVFVNTSFMQGCFDHLVSDWIGDDGFIRKFRMEMRRMNILGDTMVLKGKVTNKYVQDGENLVDADVWCENEREGVTTPCKATVRLPSKG